MKLNLVIEQQDINTAQALVRAMMDSRIVQERLANNVAGKSPVADDEKVWHTMMVCLLTSRQNSDDNGKIDRILSQQPFRLTLEACRLGSRELVFQVLKEGGARFNQRIPNFASTDLNLLDGGQWLKLREMEKALRTQLEINPSTEQYLLERQAANYMAKTFKRFGPKQSRNFWQILGVTRYEFVLDSRFMNWLRALDPSFVIPADALNDEVFYEWLSDILREHLCIPAGVCPVFWMLRYFLANNRTAGEARQVVRGTYF